MRQSIAILGSTGSIGTQALDVVDLHSYDVKALTAYSDTKKIEEQIRKYKPQYAALMDENAAKELKIKVADTAVKVLSGMDGICECASIGADTVLNGIVGMAGLRPTLAAIDAHSRIALANKETLVAGGALVMDRIREKNVEIIPVDSEHSAIFQSLQGECKEIKRILLTASGGPFFGKSKKELDSVTVEQALNHPNWEMGAKITIDSASMMNKGLELIEAVWLFGVGQGQIKVLVHRQSIVHSMVEFNDNSVIAQLGLPDMRVPIQYALTYPERAPSPARQLELEEIGSLTFEKTDDETFECINICRSAVEKGGLFPAAVNSANETANLLFRQGKIKFLQIAEVARRVLDECPEYDSYTLEDVLETDKWAREKVVSYL